MKQTLTVVTSAGMWRQTPKEETNGMEAVLPSAGECTAKRLWSVPDAPGIFSKTLFSVHVNPRRSDRGKTGN